MDGRGLTSAPKTPTKEKREMNTETMDNWLDYMAGKMECSTQEVRDACTKMVASRDKPGNRMRIEMKRRIKEARGEEAK